MTHIIRLSFLNVGTPSLTWGVNSDPIIRTPGRCELYSHSAKETEEFTSEKPLTSELLMRVRRRLATRRAVPSSRPPPLLLPLSPHTPHVPAITLTLLNCSLSFYAKNVLLVVHANIGKDNLQIMCQPMKRTGNIAQLYYFIKDVW